MQQSNILRTLKLGSTTAGPKAMPIKLKPAGAGSGLVISSGGKQVLTTTTAGEGGKVLLRASKIKFNTEQKSAAIVQSQPQQ